MKNLPSVLLSNKHFRLVATSINKSINSDTRHAVQWNIALENDVGCLVVKAERCSVNLLGEESWSECNLAEAEYSLLKDMILKEAGPFGKQSDKMLLNETKQTVVPTKLSTNVKAKSSSEE
jgi:hypothetical protein